MDRCLGGQVYLIRVRYISAVLKLLGLGGWVLGAGGTITRYTVLVVKE
jgi:hypothetical protein